MGLKKIDPPRMSTECLSRAPSGAGLGERLTEYRLGEETKACVAWFSALAK